MLACWNDSSTRNINTMPLRDRLQCMIRCMSNSGLFRYSKSNHGTHTHTHTHMQQHTYTHKHHDGDLERCMFGWSAERWEKKVVHPFSVSIYLVYCCQTGEFFNFFVVVAFSDFTLSILATGGARTN